MHYTLVFKHRKGKEIYTTKHLFLFTARCFARALKKRGFKMLVLLRTHP